MGSMALDHTFDTEYFGVYEVYENNITTLRFEDNDGK